MPRNASFIVPEDLYQMAWVEDPQISPDGAWVAFVKLTVDQARNGYHRALWLVPTSGGAPRQFTKGEPGEHRTRIKLDTGVGLAASVDGRRGKPGDRVEVGIRPEHTVLLDDPRADNKITGTVQVAEHLGAETFVYMDVGGKDFTVKVRPETPAAMGSQFDIGVPADACYLFDAKGLAFPRTARFNRS